MFELEEAIAEWRRRMEAGGVRDLSALDELEAHLREDVERQVRVGTPGLEAFAAAAKRIGNAKPLAAEFREAEGRGATVMRLARRWGMVVFAGAYVVMAGGPTLFRLGNFSTLSARQEYAVLAAIVLSGFLMVSGIWTRRWLPVIPRKGPRMAVCFAAGMVVALWNVEFFNLVMNRWELDTSHFVVAFLWDWVSAAALCGLMNGLEDAAAGRTATAGG
jgi:hypothetical protein